MKRLGIAALAAVLVTPAIGEGLPKEICSSLGPKMNSASEASSQYLAGITQANLALIQNSTSGEMRKSVSRAEDARAQLIPALQAYVNALEDVGYQMKLCARR